MCCVLIELSLGKMWMFQWSEYMYVVIVFLFVIWFYCSKNVEYLDYEVVYKVGMVMVIMKFLFYFV